MSAKWTFWAWEQPIKTAPKKLALLQLANNANDDGKSWYSIGKMAVACGVSERTFQRQIQSLEDEDLLHVERRSNRPSIYILKDEVCVTLHDRGDTESPQGDSVTGQGDRESPLGVSESHTILTTTPNNYPIIDPRPDGLNCEAWDKWVSFRAKCKFKKYKTDSAMNKLATMGDKETQALIIQQSIDNEYQGLFPIKQQGQQGKDINKIGSDFSAPEGFKKMIFGDNGEMIGYE